MNHPEQPVLVHMDKFVTKQRVHMTLEEVEEFLRHTEIMEIKDIKSQFKLENVASLSDLLRGFFEFYSKFEFDKRVITLATKPVNTKASWSKGMFVENPFDCSLNAAKNVSLQKVSDLQNKCVRTLVVMHKLGQKLTLPKLMSEIERGRDNKNKLSSINDVLTREMYDY